MSQQQTQGIAGSMPSMLSMAPPGSPESQPHTPQGSAQHAPLRISLSKLPVASGKLLLGTQPLSPYTLPLNMTSTTSNAGRLQGSDNSRSISTSPARPTSTSPCAANSSAGIAVAFLQQPQQPQQHRPWQEHVRHKSSQASPAITPGSNLAMSSVKAGTTEGRVISTQKAMAAQSVAAESTVLDDTAMDSIIQDPVKHLIQQSAHILSQPAHTTTAAVTAAAAACSPETAAASSGCRSSTHKCNVGSSSGSGGSSQPAVHPISRDDAIHLEMCLSSLPSGSLLAAQQQQINAWGKQQQQHWIKCLEAALLEVYQQHLGQAQNSEPPQQQQHLSVDNSGLQQHQQQQQQLLWQQQQQQQQQPGGHHPWLSQQLVVWQRQVSQLLQQLTHQVAYHCIEHGRTLASLQDRYAELANTLFLALSTLSQQYALSSTLLAGSKTLVALQQSEASLTQQLVLQTTAAEDARADSAFATAKYEQLQQDSQETFQLLQQQLERLQQQLWQERLDRERSEAAAAAAAAEAAEASARMLEEADDEITALKQRLAFTQGQLHAQRQPLQVLVPDTHCAEVQTEAEAQGAADRELEATPPELLPSESSDELSEEGMSEASLPPELNLLEFAKRGHKRSRLWLLKVLGQVTADKAVADAVADRQGITRSSMKEFLVTWSLNRYGLQHLSHQMLGDLVANILRHAASGLLPAIWFARFCSIYHAVKPLKDAPGQQQHHQSYRTHEDMQSQRQKEDVVPAGLRWPSESSATASRGSCTDEEASSAGKADAAGGAASELPSGRNFTARCPTLEEAQTLLGSSAALDFWLFCACQLAYPNSVVALFPGDQDQAIPLVRSSLVLESLKAAFRYLSDPGGQTRFVTERLESALSNIATPADAAANASSSSRPGTYSGVAAAASSSSTAGRAAFSSSGASRTGAASAAGAAGGAGGRHDLYCAWSLLDLLLDEWLERAWGNMQQMERLKRTIGALKPPLGNQYAAAMAAASSAAASIHDALVSKLQDAYSTFSSHLSENHALDKTYCATSSQPKSSSSGSSGPESALETAAFTEPSVTALAGLRCQTAAAGYDALSAPSSSVDGIGQQVQPNRALPSSADVQVAWESYRTLLFLMEQAHYSPSGLEVSSWPQAVAVESAAAGPGGLLEPQPGVDVELRKTYHDDFAP